MLAVPAVSSLGTVLLAHDSLPVVGFGDSMTAPGSGYFDLFAAQFAGRAHFNEGIGRQRTAHIVARIGAKPFTIAIPGRLLGREPQACVPSIDLLTSDRPKLIKVALPGVGPCVLRGDPAAGYTITTDKTVRVADCLPARVVSGYTDTRERLEAAPGIETLHRGLIVIRAGRNDLSANDFSISSIISDIWAAVSLVRRSAEKVIVAGVTNGSFDLPVRMGGKSAHDDHAVMVLDRTTALNEALRRAFGDGFVDPLANHLSKGGGSQYEIGGRLFSVLGSEVLIDGVHENDRGKDQTASLIYAKYLSM